MDKFLSEYRKGGTGGGDGPPPHPQPPDPTQDLMKGRSKKRKENKEEPIPSKEAQIKKKRKIDYRELSMQREGREDPPLPSDWSIFTPDPETATTTVFLAPSFSGKTSLIVEHLNRLTDEDLRSYASIVLCTESISAAPLKLLSDRLLEKMNIFDCFLPEYVSLMKRTNTLTHNRFRYLVIMDDCLKLKGDVVEDMILTLRNSGVSTAISIQYSKLLKPAQRQSVHDYYLMNLRLEDLEYLLTGFIASHMRDRLHEEGDSEAYDYSVKKLAAAVRHRLKDRKILHYDQRHDNIKIYSNSYFYFD
ncbi:MAG: hypothetical protein JKX97_09260 [Candidatus Lindowbacteria bacterium]|nr:hypothetical protein [Candidatus Lindowbacteria bacterium]